MGIAPDGGLFMPTEIPAISQKEFHSLKDSAYSETAFIILQKFLKDILTNDELQFIVEDAYNLSETWQILHSYNHITSALCYGHSLLMFLSLKILLS